MKTSIECIAEIIDKYIDDNNKYISVVGCGGKTTLIRMLAFHYAAEMKVAVAASTKMLLPDGEWSVEGRFPDIHTPEGILKAPYTADCVRLPVDHKCIDNNSGNITFYTDRILPVGKISGFGSAMQSEADSHSNIVLIEADGSRGKPLKGWESYEPLIIYPTLLVIGILPMHVLGCRADSDKVFRMPLFTGLTGLNEGDIIDTDAYVIMICSPHGLFGKPQPFKVRRLLFLNRCLDEGQYRSAEIIAERCRGYIDYAVCGTLF